MSVCVSVYLRPCIYNCIYFYICLYICVSTYVCLYIYVYVFTCVCVCVWFGLVSLFNGISTFSGLFNAEAILLKEQYWYYLTHSWEKARVL